MRPDELAAHSRKQAAENDAAVLAVLAAAGDAGIRPGRELVELVGLAETTTRVAVARLVEHGLARRDGKRLVWATDAGRSEAGADMPGLSLTSALKDALAFLPAEALRAFARLQVAAVPARWHLAREITDGWGSFIAIGPTASGKTSVAKLICRIFGLDELGVIKAAFRQTPGSLVGRRLGDGGSATGYRVEPSPVLELPYLCIDEWDKAPREVQAAAGGLLMGDTADELERERVEIRPTVYVTLNTGRDGLGVLHQAHVRRSVVLDTTELAPLLVDIDDDMARLFGGEVPIPRLSLDRIKPMPSLPAELRRLLRAELRTGLTPAGWLLTDVEALSRIALGRAAITEGPLEDAVLATALDYLTCASTLGHAQDGFAARLASRLGARGALAPDPAAVEQQQRELDAAHRGRVQTRDREALVLVGARNTLAEELRQARPDGRRLLPARRPPAAGLRAQLDRLREEVASSRSAERLAELREIAHPLLAEADHLRRSDRDERAAATAAEEQRRAQARQASQQRQAQAESGRHATELLREAARRQADAARVERDRERPQTAAELVAVRREAKALEQLRTRRDGALGAFAVLRYARALGRPLIEFEAPEDLGGGLGMRLFAVFAGGEGMWRSTFSPSIMVTGTATACPELDRWGPRTLAVIEPALRELRQLEDRLQHQAGQARGPKPRSTRGRQKRARASQPHQPSRATPGPADRVRCIQCGTTYGARRWLGLPRTCSRCNGPVAPIT